MPDEITVASTTDTPEQVAAAVADPTTPPAPETAQVPETPPAETPAAPVTTPEAAPEEKPESRAERRIAKLTYERAQSDARAEKAEREAQELKEKLASIPVPAPASTEPAAPAPFTEKAPSIDDFETVQEWAEAYNGYTDRRSAHITSIEVGKALATERKRVETTRQQSEQQNVLVRHQTRIEEFKKTHTDFDAVAQEAIDSQMPISEAVMRHCISSEMGPAIMYHLAKNRAENDRIAALPPAAAYVELGRLEAKLENGNGSAAPPAGGNPPQQTRPAAVPTTQIPPPPIAPLGGGSVATNKSPDEMDQEEFNRWREGGGGR